MNTDKKVLAQKVELKKIRKQLESNKKLDSGLKSEIVEQINCLIGRLNCLLTDDDTILGAMAVNDGLRD